MSKSEDRQARLRERGQRATLCDEAASLLQRIIAADEGDSHRLPPGELSKLTRPVPSDLRKLREYVADLRYVVAFIEQG
jgi:hypothetical protein